MNYNLVYTRRAEKDLKKLDSSIKSRIGNALLKLQDNPLLYSEKLSDPVLGTYKFRIGDYSGCSPQGEKQKCLKSLTVTGLYAEREVFFS